MGLGTELGRSRISVEVHHEENGVLWVLMIGWLVG